jgi:Ca2+-binding RTX toxin-like protein
LPFKIGCITKPSSALSKIGEVSQVTTTVDTSVLADKPIIGVKIGAAIVLRADATSDFPDASNTGVPDGTKMKVFTGTYYVTKNNAVISNLEVHGDIVIQAKNVTMSNIKLVSDTRWHALRVMDDATGFTLKDSEIDGNGNTVNAIYGFGTFLRNNLHDVENGINTTEASHIRDNYIHNLRGGSDAHYDGIENNGASHVRIIHNTIINHHDQTSAVMLNNEFGSLSDITIENNRLVGGGYTVYLDGRKGGGAVDDGSIRIINNQIGDGEWGNFAFYNDRPVVSGNVGLDVNIPEPGKPVLIIGTDGDDTLPKAGIVNTGNETFYAMGGNDLVHSGKGNDKLHGGNGNDTLFGNRGNDIIHGDDDNDIIHGGAGNDRLFGGADADAIFGGAGNDTIIGGAGGDIIVGGKGHDVLFGGLGADIFVFNGINQSRNAKIGNDVIKDFTHADTIDLRVIDANHEQALNQRFDFIGTQQFHDQAGELRFFRRGSDTVIQADVDGDGKADFSLRLDDVIKLSAHDFLL